MGPICSRLRRMRADRFLPLAFALSLIVHLILVAIVLFVPKDWIQIMSTPFVSKIPIEKPSLIEVVLNERKDSQQIVRQADAPTNMLDNESMDPARFLSERKQRVVLETKARETGKTQNRQNSMPRYQRELLQNKIREQLKTLSKDEDGDIVLKPKSQTKDYEPMELFPKDQFMNSTLGEVLPDNVSIGDFTALNTNQYQFYTFYARVEDLVRFRWEGYVRNAIDLFDRRRIIKSIAQKSWVTQIEFLIDRDGHLKKAILLKESGIPQFDQSSVKAFEDAKVFPNPPKEMIQDDGYIHLRYSFHVYFNPSYMAR